MGLKMLIGADIVPTEKNINRFISGDTDYLIGNRLKSRFNNADFIVLNLEVPLADSKKPIRKCGPCLIAPTAVINGIKKINPYFLNLANNHILDHGVEGLQSTIKVLTENKIDFSGVGLNLLEARKPYIRKIGMSRVGIFCCAEHEYSIATNKKPGANPYDPLVSFDDVKELKRNCDYVVVLYHGGKEHYRYPSPMLQRVFRKFADSGADLVVAQHSHCIGCKEEYKGSTLVYGQGNFLFDHSTSEFWKTSLLLEVDLESKEIHFIPIVKDDDRVREAVENQALNILKEFEERSEAILENDFLEKRYSDYAKKMEAEYLIRFSGKIGNIFLVRALNKLTSYRMIKRLYGDQYKVVIENVLDCEAHRELASQIMRSHK